MKRRGSLSFLVCGLLVALAVVFLDRPMALWAQQRLYLTTPYRVSTSVFVFYEVAGIALLAGAALQRLRDKTQPGDWGGDLSLAAGAGLLALLVAELLKWITGRSPVCPDFLVNGVAGLRPFHWGTFPSATTAAVTAVLTVAWLRRPAGRALYAVFLLAAPLAILITNSHWLSDVIAGTWLGATIGSAVSRGQ